MALKIMNVTETGTDTETTRDVGCGIGNGNVMFLNFRMEFKGLYYKTK